MVFTFEVRYLFFNVAAVVLKLFTSFNLFSNLCSKSLFSNGVDGYTLSDPFPIHVA